MGELILYGIARLFAMVIAISILVFAAFVFGGYLFVKSQAEKHNSNAYKVVRTEHFQDGKVISVSVDTIR